MPYAKGSGVATLEDGKLTHQPKKKKRHICLYKPLQTADDIIIFFFFFLRDEAAVGYSNKSCDSAPMATGNRGDTSRSNYNKLHNFLHTLLPVHDSSLVFSFKVSQ